MSKAESTRRRLLRFGETADEAGFTLIELLVVLLIIGVLLAIAIPTFLSVSNSASDTSAQADLETALTGAKTFYMQNNSTYTNISLGPIGTGLSVVTGTNTSGGPHVVSIAKPNGTEIILASLGNGASDCWGLVDIVNTTTVLGFTGPGTLFFEAPGSHGQSSIVCKASSFTGASKPVGLKTSTTGFANVR